MAGGNQYKCPECDFVGKLGRLHKHLRENPSHWMVRCKDCGHAIVTKKGYKLHRNELNHDTGIKLSDIVNVQKTTKTSPSPRANPTVKSSTKHKLIRLGIDENDANLLATGRNWSQLQELKIPDFAEILSEHRWKKLNEIAKIIIPDINLRVPHNPKTLLNIVDKYSIKDKESLLEAALLIAEDKDGRVNKQILDMAAKQLSSTLLHTRRQPPSPQQKLMRQRNNRIHQIGHGKISGLSISNFKGFRHVDQTPKFIPIRPLTMVYGPNNGGKSSILKGFSSLAQTIAKRKLLQGDFDWSPSGMWFDLGATPHVLNEPERSQFTLGYVIETENHAESDWMRYYELRFQISLSNNIGKLSTIEMRGGNFEDYLSPIIRLEVSNQANPMEVFSGRLFELSYIADELKQKALHIEEKNECMIKEMDRYKDMLEDLDDNEKLVQKKFQCTECDFSTRKLKTMSYHLKKSHKKIPNADYTITGFSANLLRNIRQFMAVHTPNLGMEHQDYQGRSHQNQFVIESWREVLKQKGMQFEITEDYNLGEDLMNPDIPTDVFSAAITQEYRVRSFFSSAAQTGFRGNRIHFTGNIAIEGEVDIMNALFAALNRQLTEMDYLGATRLIPRRTYSSQTGGQTSQGISGERTLAHLANNSRIQNWVNENLADMIGLNVKVRTRKTTITLPDGSKKQYPLDELDVRISRTDSPEDRLQLPDVGFGVSQLLPILTGICSPGRMVIEEPEANLHPGAQQKLMNKIIEQIVTNKESSVIMETHSEHFLLEVLRAISDPDCPLQDEDVAILYTYNTPEHGTVVKRHTTTDGTLDERFPKEFTGDYGLSMI